MQARSLAVAVDLARGLGATTGKMWSVVLPTLRQQGEQGKHDKVNWASLYDVSKLKELTKYAYILDAAEYLAKFDSSVDANFFILSKGDKGGGSDGCPDDSTDGSSPRFSEGYSSYKPKAEVEKDGRKECFYSDKKLHMKAHACGPLEGDACSPKFHEQLLDLMDGGRTLMVGNVNHLTGCPNPDGEGEKDNGAYDGSEYGVQEKWPLAPIVLNAADEFIASKLEVGRYVAVALERGEAFREKHPDNYLSEDQIVDTLFKLGSENDNFHFFVMIDKKNELIYLRKKLQNKVNEASGMCSTDGTCPAVELHSYRKKSGMKGMQAQKVNVLVAARAKIFVGTHQSEGTKAVIDKRKQLEGLKEGDAVMTKEGELKSICIPGRGQEGNAGCVAF
jgi:hypothetical protein